MKRDELDRFILDAATEYNRPPETPREEMWASIRTGLSERERRRTPLDVDAHRSRRARVSRLRRWTPWAIGVATAATLAAGFGLGRVTHEVAPRPAATASAPGAERPSLTVGMAAVAHLGEAEALLTLFRSSEPESDRARTAAWARELLMTTRLMLDSRVGDDPGMAQLLGDLELVLVQIVNAGGAGGAGETEQELIEEGIEQRQLMAKLRSAGSGSAGMAL